MCLRMETSNKPIVLKAGLFFLGVILIGAIIIGVSNFTSGDEDIILTPTVGEVDELKTFLGVDKCADEKCITDALSSDVIKDKIFTKLVSNKADITQGEAIFEVYIPYNNLSVKNINFSFINGKGLGISSYQILVNSSEDFIPINKKEAIRQVEYEQPNYGNPILINQTCPPYPLDNKTLLDCSYFKENITGYTRKLIDEKYLADNYYLDKGHYQIKINANWRAIKGEQSIDWVPVLTIDKEMIESLQDINMANPSWSWWNVTYTYKNSVIINSSVSSTLTNFPAYFVLNTSALISDGKMQSACQDLRIIDSTDTVSYSFEIENNTCNTSSTVVWFKYPSLATGNQTVSIYYGNPSAIDGQDKSTLWSEYSLVLHFAETSGNFSDSSGKTSFGCSRGTTSIVTDGKYGNALGLNSGFVKCDEPGPSPWNVTTAFTVSGWLRPYSTNYIVMLDKGKQASQIAWEVRRDVTTKTATVYGVNGGTFTSTATMENGTLYYLAFRHGGTDQININTSTKTGTLTDPSYVTSNPLCIGAQSYSGTCTKLGDTGTVDEVRLTNQSRSNDWLNAEYNQVYYVVTTGEVSCAFGGLVKDGSGNALSGATIAILTQDSMTVSNITSNATGGWAISILNNSKNYTAIAYYNNTLIGQAKPFIVSTC